MENAGPLDSIRARDFFAKNDNPINLGMFCSGPDNIPIFLQDPEKQHNMPQLLVSAATINTLTNAGTPGEAAQAFLDAVSRGLAAVIAEKLGEVLTATVNASAANANIAGWNNLIKGASIDLVWERPQLGLAPAQICAFAPYTTDGVNALGVNVGIGINISASF